MKKILLVIIVIVKVCFGSAQIRGEYKMQPFPVYMSGQQVGIAASVNTFVYSNYFSKDVLKQGYANPHDKPEYLITAMFTAIQKNNLKELKNLYDQDAEITQNDLDKMHDALLLYTDIQFHSKFESGDFAILNYEFYAVGNAKPYFSPIVKDKGKYFLTLDINMSNPFIMVASWASNKINFKLKTPLQLNNFIAIHFNCTVNNTSCSYNEKANKEATLFLDIKRKNSQSEESVFLNRLHQLCMSPGKHNLNDLLIPEQAKFIGDTTNIISFSYDRIYEMMKHCQNVELLGTVDLSEKKKIAFFYVKSEGLPIQTSSVMLEKLNGNYYLDLQENDNTLRSIFQNIYINEAIGKYFSTN